MTTNHFTSGPSMELVLTLTNCSGALPEDAKSARVSGDTCTVGRHPSCQLRLPDPDCQVSGRHALIKRQGDRFSVTDISTNGTFLNDAESPLEPNRPVELRDGDRLTIGQYIIGVSIVPADGPAMSSGPRPIGAEATDLVVPESRSTADILDLIASADAASNAPVASALAQDELPPELQQNSPGGSEAVPGPAPSKSLRSGPPKGRVEKGEKKAQRGARAPVKPDRKPQAPEAGASSTMIRSNDDATALANHIQPQLPDDDAVPPTTETATQPPPPKKTVALPGSAPSIATQESIASQPTRESPPPCTSEPPKVDAKADRLRQPAAGREGSTQNNAGSAEADASSAPPTMHSRVPADELSAFLTGLGAGDPSQMQDSEQVMHTAGELLRAMTEGLLALMMARASFKSELRLGVTTIRAQENNPFQFCADAEDTLERLLWRPSRGFLDPASAAHRAFDDVRSHQMALMAGLRGVMQALLARLEPHAIEQRAEEHAGLGGLLPNGRKAKCWDLFVAAFDEVADDTSEDFMRLFGDAFNRAYDEQIQRLVRAKRQETD